MNFTLPKGEPCRGCPRFDQPRCAVSATYGQVQVLFVAQQPDKMSADNNEPLSGHGGRIVRKAIQELKRARPQYRDINIAFTYAVQCTGIKDEREHPDKAVMTQCNVNVQSTIGRLKPQIIVAMGADALRQLGVSAKFSDVQHKFVSNLRYQAPVFVTFAEAYLAGSPGIYQTFGMNLVNVFDELLYKNRPRPTLEELAKDYQTPKTIDDAIAVCQQILNYGSDTIAPENWPISVDTETNTLRPEKESAKIIAFCFGWAIGRATTILYDHPHAGEEYLARLPELKGWIAKVLQSSKPKIFHNAKFDLKFIELQLGIEVANVTWCTLLGEHLLDEDKKGNYGLKDLTRNMLKAYSGYEDKLHDLLHGEETSRVEEAQKQIDDLAPILADDHPAYLRELEAYKEALVTYERELVDNQKTHRTYALAMDDYAYQKGVLAGRVAVWELDTADWPAGQRGKPKKPIKWFQKPERPPVLREPKKPKDPRSKKEQQVSRDAGFENIPVHDLQQYGAVDADVTRQLTSIQRFRIRTEGSKVVPLMRSHAIPASRTLGRMEYEGTRVDLPYIDQLDEAASKIISETEQEIYDMAGRRTPGGKEMNLNHSGTLANVLFSWGVMHPDGGRIEAFPCKDYTKQGHAMTGEKILRRFLSYEEDGKTPTRDALFVERFLQYRKASKAKNTFLANVRALSRRDGYLHTQFHLNGTGTGRLSCVAADTKLETNLGTFCISDPVLPSLLPHLQVLTHKNRWRRVTRVFLKGHDPMFRVTTNTGETIKCTMDHRFLTPTGWKKLRELDVAQEIQTYVEVPNRAGAAGSADRGQRDATGSARPGRDVAHHVLSADGVSGEVQDGAAGSGPQTLRSLEAGQYARAARAARGVDRQGGAAEGAAPGDAMARDGAGVQLQRIPVDSQHAAPWLDVHRRLNEPCALSATRELLDHVGEAGASTAGHLRCGQDDDRTAGRVFRATERSAFATARGAVGGSVHREAGALLHGQTGRLVLESEQGGSSLGLSSTCSRDSLSAGSPPARGQDIATDRLSNRPASLRRSRWCLSPDRGGDADGQAQGIDDLPYGDGFDSFQRVPSVAQDERSLGENPGGVAALHADVRTSRIARIEPLGVQEVWDLTVEEDASYRSAGFLNHNSSDMNMQNLPKFLSGFNLKKLFIPDDDSYLIVNVDYKGAEVRVFTAYAHDKALIQALNDGMDMHSFFAANVFKQPYELYEARDTGKLDAVTNKRVKKERDNIKRVVFGILYGAGAPKIAETIGIEEHEAEKLIALLYQMFPEIERYAKVVEAEVDRQGYVETLFGRRRRFPLSDQSRYRRRAHRQARNFKVQSTSSDIVIGQLIEMDEPLRRDVGGRLLLTVHDSLVFQWPKKYIGQLNDFVSHYAVQRVREKYAWLPVPFQADVEIGSNYGECQSVEAYLKQNPLIVAQEGVVEEHELLTELRNAVFDSVA